MAKCNKCGKWKGVSKNTTLILFLIFSVVTIINVYQSGGWGLYDLIRIAFWPTLFVLRLIIPERTVCRRCHRSNISSLKSKTSVNIPSNFYTNGSLSEYYEINKDRKKSQSLFSQIMSSKKHKRLILWAFYFCLFGLVIFLGDFLLYISDGLLFVTGLWIMAISTSFLLIVFIRFRDLNRQNIKLSEFSHITNNKITSSQRKPFLPESFKVGCGLLFSIMIAFAIIQTVYLRSAHIVLTMEEDKRISETFVLLTIALWSFIMLFYVKSVLAKIIFIFLIIGSIGNCCMSRFDNSNMSSNQQSTIIPKQTIVSNIKQQIYVDRNSFFSMWPPYGWIQREFPNEPRSKVEFSHPTERSVRLRIIAQMVSQDVNYEKIAYEIKTMPEKIRQMTGRNIICEEYQIQCCGYPAFKLKISGGGINCQEITLFLAGSIKMNISYEAINNTLLEKYREEVMQSVSSIKIRHTNNTPVDQNIVKEHYIANRIKIAQELLRLNNYKGAEDTIREALIRYPNDLRLLQALQSISHDKRL